MDNLTEIPIYYHLNGGGVDVDLSQITAEPENVDVCKLFVNSNGELLYGTSTYKADYLALNSLVGNTTATESDVDSGKLFVKADGSQGSGTSTYKSDYTALHTLVGQTTAEAEDVAQGKVFVNSSGVQTTGTASGGSDEILTKLIERESDTDLVIPDGTTYIADYAFYQNSGLRNVTIPSTVTSIGVNSFRECSNLQTTLPDTITNISKLAFGGCTSLVITSMPTGMTVLNESAFEVCTSIQTLTTHNRLKKFYKNVFYGCTGLTSVTINCHIEWELSSSGGLDSQAFKNCTNLTTIRVPWSSGAVPGAPWGATNASVIYSYQP